MYKKGFCKKHGHYWSNNGCPVCPDVSESTETAGYNAKYIKKLIKEIESDIAKEMVEIEGELCYPQKWINVSLLCDAVSKML